MPTDTPDLQRPSSRHQSHRLIATVAIASVAAVMLSACGSSGNSKSSSGTSTTQSSTSRSNRFASLRACLQKEGINLPSTPTGGQAPGSGGPPGAGGGFKPPEGVSQTKFQEALKKCGGNFRGGARPGFNSATARTALTKYASCMRENGVNLPAPNTSGKGPIFDTKGIDRSSASFKNAQQKCQSNLKGAFGAGGRPPSGEGAPPAGAEGAPPEAPPGPEGSAAG